MTDHHELALVAACLCDPTRYADCHIDGTAFSDPQLGALYDALRLLADSGVPMRDVPAILPRLRDMKLEPKYATAAFLAELLTMSYEAAKATYYAEVIRAEHQRRKLAKLLDDAQIAVTAPRTDVWKLTRQLEANFATADMPNTRQPERVVVVYDRVAEHLLSPDQGDRGGIYTGIPSHDDKIGGWRPGELIILAARPGVGKTALGQQIAWHQATRGRNPAFVSLEMSSDELITRMIAGLTGIDSRDMRRGNLTREQRITIQTARDSFESSSLVVWDPPRATTGAIRAFAKRRKAADGIDLLVVDYLQLVEATDRRMNRHEQVSEMSASLKRLAKELECPVLCLAQLNRQADGQPPRLSHLRESGSIEQDADSVIFLHPDEKDKVFLVVEKNRHGTTGKFALRFDRRRTTFTEWETPVAECASYDNRFEAYSQEDF